MRPPSGMRAPSGKRLTRLVQDKERLWERHRANHEAKRVQSLSIDAEQRREAEQSKTERERGVRIPSPRSSAATTSGLRSSSESHGGIVTRRAGAAGTSNSGSTEGHGDHNTESGQSLFAAPIPRAGRFVSAASEIPRPPGPWICATCRWGFHSISVAYKHAADSHKECWACQQVFGSVEEVAEHYYTSETCTKFFGTPGITSDSTSVSSEEDLNMLAGATNIFPQSRHNAHDDDDRQPFYADSISRPSTDHESSGSGGDDNSEAGAPSTSAQGHINHNDHEENGESLSTYVATIRGPSCKPREEDVNGGTMEDNVSGQSSSSSAAAVQRPSYLNWFPILPTAGYDLVQEHSTNMDCNPAEQSRLKCSIAGIHPAASEAVEDPETPNLCRLLGKETAQQLVKVAGGLSNLVKSPSCRVQRDCSRNVLFSSDLLQNSPPVHRKKFWELLSDKTILAARFDALRSKTRGDFSEEQRKRLMSAIEAYKDPEKKT